MSNYVTVLDVSYHQGSIDWTMMEQAKVKGIIVRTSDGVYNKDTKFREWYRQAHDQEWLTYGVSHYHFMRFNQSWHDQVDNIVEMTAGLPVPTLHGLPGYSFLDCEVTDGADIGTISSKITKAINYGDEIGYPFGIYTSKLGFWDSNVYKSSFWGLRPLWVANWTSALEPYMPRDWATWDVWQYKVGKGIGHVYGVGSKDIDINRMRTDVITPPPAELPKEIDVTLNVDGTQYIGQVTR